jgi:AmiR/NasT family two-component response regulator
MMEQWATAHVIESLQSRRDLDMANGILVALRRCGPDAAHRELLGAAKRHGVGVMAMS